MINNMKKTIVRGLAALVLLSAQSCGKQDETKTRVISPVEITTSINQDIDQSSNNKPEIDKVEGDQSGSVQENAFSTDGTLRPYAVTTVEADSNAILPYGISLDNAGSIVYSSSLIDGSELATTRNNALVNLISNMMELEGASLPLQYASSAVNNQIRNRNPTYAIGVTDVATGNLNETKQEGWLIISQLKDGFSVGPDAQYELLAFVGGVDSYMKGTVIPENYMDAVTKAFSQPTPASGNLPFAPQYKGGNDE